ncbi:translation initiation factor eIF4e [Lentinula aciculospora]|uniref:Translation initiation factor eIF4e n=1 Tax=Lentinula aciculospora TaxID=153920 RepID=A0A9W9A3W9_9AGAR|nr:translation initiation factor eIF4e [Lentinula aciculospora]
MANSYFSNYSQSRFLAISSQTPGGTQPPPSNQTGPKSRLPSSKHFSTSISSGSDRSTSKEKPSNGSSPNGSEPHPLRNTWVFWFRQQRTPGNKLISYEEGIKKISAFASAESFWSLWTHLAPPSALQPTTDYLLFHDGIRRPVWEDPVNISGGKWIIRLKKGVADRIWEDLVLAVLGDQFDECRRVEEDGEVAANWEDGSDSGAELPEICGCTISVRQSEDIISLWNRLDGDLKVRERIRDTIRNVLHLPPSTIMEYKSNNDSMQDKSSFRNSAIDRTPAS